MQRTTWFRLGIQAVVVALTVVACSHGGGSAKGTIVEVWGSGSADATVMSQYLQQRFKPGNPDGIQARFQSIPTVAYSQQLPLALRTGRAPDVFRTNRLAALINSHFLLPLDNVLSAQTKTAYQAGYAQPSQFIHDGKLYAVPTSAVVFKLAYNRELFRRAGLDPKTPPKTYSQVAAAAKAITRRVPGAYGFGLPLKWEAFVEQGLEPAVLDANPELTQRGLYNVRTHRYEAERYEPIIRLFRTMLADHSTYPGPASLANDPMRSAFARGRIGMYFSAGYDVALIDGTYKSTADWTVANLPVPDDGAYQQTVTRMGGDWAVNARTGHQAAAAKVLEAILSTQLQSQLVKRGINYPVSTAVPAGIVPTKMPQYKLFKFDPATDQVVPARPTDELKIQGADINTVVIKLIIGTDPLQPALHALSAKYNKALDQAVQNGSVHLSDYGYPPHG